MTVTDLQSHLHTTSHFECDFLCGCEVGWRDFTWHWTFLGDSCFLL